MAKSKYVYNITYRIRPNKKTEGVQHSANLTFEGDLKGDKENAGKLLRFLCSVHRVNPDAVIFQNIRLVEIRKVGVVDSVVQKVKGFFGGKR